MLAQLIDMRTSTLITAVLTASLLGGCSSLPIVGHKKAKSVPMADAIDPGLKIAVDVVMARLRDADEHDLQSVKRAAPEIYQLAAALMPPANGPMRTKQASLDVPPARPNTLGDLQRMEVQKASAARTLGAVANGARIYRAAYRADGSRSIKPAPALKDARSLFYAVHLGSYRSASRAFEGYTQIKAKTPGVLTDLEPRVERVDLGAKGIFERLKAGPFTSRKEALSVCSQLHQSGQYCVPADFTGRTPG